MLRVLCSLYGALITARLRQKSLLKAYGLHKHLEIHRAAWQRKRKVEANGNTNFYFSGGLCLTSECVKHKLAGKTRKDASLLKAFCLHPCSTSSQMPAPLEDQHPEMLLLLAWCQYSELLQRQFKTAALFTCALHLTCPGTSS